MDYTITDIKQQTKNPNRINVFLNGEFAFGCSRYAGAWLQIGQSLSQEKIDEIKGKDGVEIAYQKALRLISYRPRSIFEMRTRLEEKEIPSDVIEKVIDLLVEKELLNDSKFSETWVDNRMSFRPRSRRVIQAELRRKGIDENIIQNTLHNMVDEEKIAITAGAKYINKFRNLDWQSFKQKMIGVLSRKGFSYETIYSILPKLWEETNQAANQQIIGISLKKEKLII